MQTTQIKIKNLVLKKRMSYSYNAHINSEFTDEAINNLSTEIADAINNISPIAPIFNNDKLNINRKILINIIYRIFSDSSIVDSYNYSILLIKEIYHLKNLNVPLSCKKLYYEIFGFTYNDSYKNIHSSIHTFTKAFFDYKALGERPIYIMDVLENAFNNRLPLACFDNEPLSKFKRNRNYMIYGLIEKFGENSFISYLNDMIGNYCESVYNLDSLITFHSIAAYIYGEDSILAHSFYYKYVQENYNNILFKLTYKVIYPLTYYHTNSFAQRNIIYKFLELSETEINEKENNWYSTNSKKPSNKIYTNLNSISKGDLIPAEVIAQIKEQVNVLYNDAILKRTLPNRTELFTYLRESSPSDEVLKFIGYLPGHAISYSKFLSHIEDKNNELKKILCTTNDKIHFNADLWKYWEKNRTKYVCITLIFSDINSEYYKSIHKKYMTYVIKNSFGNELIRRAYSVKDFLSFLERQFENQPLIEDVKTDQILLFLHYIESKDNVKPKQLSRRNTTLKRFLIWYYDSNYIKNKILPTENLHFHNAANFISHVSPIQNDVLGNLENNVASEANVQDELIFRISLESAWRFSDIANICTDCLELDKSDKNKIILWTTTQKTRTQRIKKGLGDRIESYISVDLYNNIVDFIISTQKIREDFMIKTLFYRFNDGVPVLYSNVSYINGIQRICNDKYIQEQDENIINFQSRKTRKTVAVELINSNFSLATVQQKLKHMSSSTTAKYYAEVRKMKLAELNHEFFTQKFNFLMDEDTISKYTENERKLLYVDFCMNYRDVELGKCSRHPSEGRCNYLENNNCATCPKICTGKKNLPKWEELLKCSKTLLSEYIRIYQEHHILGDEYANYIEYKQELKLMQRYECVINAIVSKV
jgi:site-specific recombinase XerD